MGSRNHKKKLRRREILKINLKIKNIFEKLLMKIHYLREILLNLSLFTFILKILK